MAGVKQNTVVPWLRKIVLTITVGSEVKQIISDGTFDGLKVTASIKKTVMGMPNPSQISIYNLSSQTRSLIQRGLSKVTLQAGWENTELHTVFQGSVMSVLTERQGTDIVTKMNVMPGYGALMASVASVSYAEGMPVREVVKDLAKKLPGVTVTDTLLKDVKGTIGRGGWSFAGQTKDALTQLANEYGFSWNIDNEQFRGVGDKAKFDGIVVLDGKDGGLIQISPVLTGPLQIRTGVKIKAVYVPGVQPGSTVRVRSTLQEGLDGDYRINSATFSLDTYSDTWTMDLESLRYL